MAVTPRRPAVARGGHVKTISDDWAVGEQSSLVASIDVLEMNEAYEEADGEFSFAGTLVVYRARNGGIHHAISNSRYASTSDVHADHLRNDILIPAAAYSPLFSPGLTSAPDPLPRRLLRQTAPTDLV